MDLTGYLKINGTDLWTGFGAFLAETSPDAHTNMDALLRMPKAKEITAVDFRERDGVELPETPDVKLSSIDRTLQLWFSTTGDTERLDKYKALMALLTSGRLTVEVKGYRTYQLIYQDMPAEPQWFVSHDRTKFAVLFSVKFMDYSPSV